MRAHTHTNIIKRQLKLPAQATKKNGVRTTKLPREDRSLSKAKVNIVSTLELRLVLRFRCVFPDCNHVRESLLVSCNSTERSKIQISTNSRICWVVLNAFIEAKLGLRLLKTTPLHPSISLATSMSQLKFRATSLVPTIS
jgi:hypothetical protein